MNATREEIQQLENWMVNNLVHLAVHAERTAQVLQSTGGVPTAAGAKTIIRFAKEAVSGEAPTPKALSPGQIAAWKALLPLLAEHAHHFVCSSGPPATEEASFTKEEAAEFVGFSLRKLEKHMFRREITFQKFGAGQTATVRFRKSDLVEFANRRTVPARKSASHSGSGSR